MERLGGEEGQLHGARSARPRGKEIGTSFVSPSMIA
jgi:hypothetical protein